MDGVSRRAVLAGAAATAVVGAAPHRPTPIAIGDISVIAADLNRPECVAVARDGRLFVSTLGAAVTAIDPASGNLRPIGTAVASTGIALDRDERVVIANFGLLNGRRGSLDRLDPATGKTETLVAELGGRPLVGSNAPVVARDGTIYCTHSKWGNAKGVGDTSAEGFVYRVTPDGRADIVATGLAGANGSALSLDERHLYVSLTPLARIRRFERRQDGTLGEGEDFGPALGEVVAGQTIADIRALPPQAHANLGYVDNIAFDAAGNLWVCVPFANRIVAMTPAGEVIDVIRDPDGTRVSGPTAFAWGGADMRNLYIVSRGNNSLVRARTSIPGAPMVNQRFWKRASIT